MGDVVAAVDRYQDIPSAVRAVLKKRMAARQYDEIVSIRRDSIEGRATYRSEIRDMHFGTGQTCGTVTRAKWTAESQERGLVYCESGHCILVPTVCRNVSRISRAAPAAASSDSAAAVPAAPAAPETFSEASALGPGNVAEMAGVPDGAGATPQSAAAGGGGATAPGSFAQLGGLGGPIGGAGSALVVNEVANGLIGRNGPGMQINTPSGVGIPDGGGTGIVPSVPDPIPTPIPAVPEPSTYALMLMGLAGFGLRLRRGARG